MQGQGVLTCEVWVAQSPHICYDATNYETCCGTCSSIYNASNPGMCDGPYMLFLGRNLYV